MKSIKVIYIAGQGRSGSTILDRILGTIDGVSSCAEVYRIWEDGFKEHQLCSCGKGVDECPFYISVLDGVIQGPSDAQRIYELQEAIDHSKYFPKLYAGLNSSSQEKKLDELKSLLRRLYFNLARATNSEVLVDSSKVPSRALILSQIPGIDVHVIHVVRDVRAVVYSWQKAKYNPAIGRTMVKYPPHRTVSFWLMRNAFCELLAAKLPYVRIRYEDFAEQPRTALQGLVDRVHPISGKKLPFVDERQINLGPIHTIGGNPHRFRYGVTEIRMDTEWVERLDPRTRLLVTLFAYPMLMRYGYPVHNGSTRIDPQVLRVG